jgi:hypothetical protein
MNGSIPVNDPYIRPEIFKSLLPLLRHFKPNASSDTDTTLSLALFDDKKIKTIYLRYPMEYFQDSGKIFKENGCTG